MSQSLRSLTQAVRGIPDQPCYLVGRDLPGAMTDTLPLLTVLPLVVGGVLLLATLLILYFALRNAADGSEDETGFHHHSDRRIRRKLP
jgi:hypothetical protein